ncbi:MAG: CsbD family protein [Anaerolineae bacterium]|nr:CsbD family protein [Anaerolineae bacterium]
MQHGEHGGVWDQIAGAWKQVRGEVRKQWGKLTDDDLEQIKGQRDIMVGKIQQRYGIAREEAERQIDEWSHRIRL